MVKFVVVEWPRRFVDVNNDVWLALFKAIGVNPSWAIVEATAKIKFIHGLICEIFLYYGLGESGLES